MICPNCSSDYLDGIKVCVACHILLDNDSSPKPVNGKGRLVHFITYFSRFEAKAGKNLLEYFGVDATVSADEISGIRLWIQKEDIRKAVKIFQENTLSEKKQEKTH